ncbi:bacterial transcriptional activator domain-containing protein [Paenibacillus sp.]
MTRKLLRTITRRKASRYGRCIHFERILQIDSIREDIHREIILLYLSLGRRIEAQRQYLVLEELLKKELGSSPATDIKQLLRQS